MNPHRVSVKAWLASKGFVSVDEAFAFLNDSVDNGIVPAVCDMHCSTEPDGYCRHDCPSVLIAMGYI